MSVKRRDNKNRVLRNGESQLKDGRYMYKYVDHFGKSKYVYSWKLVATDKTPAGKKDSLPLRDKEKLILKDLEDNIFTKGGDITVLELVTKYVSQKTGVRYNTENNYKLVTNILKKEQFGNVHISDIKISDAKAWFIKLQKDGLKYGTICIIRGVVRPAFQMAVDDDYIRKNPFDFPLFTLLVNDSVTREAITMQQQRAFLDFIKSDKHFSCYYDGIYILFHTGMRISEFVGLTIGDIDLKDRVINIDHQLQRKNNMEYVIEKTKTSNGTIKIPMTEEVKQCFERILQNRHKPKIEPVVDGLKGFLFLDKNEMPTVPTHWQRYFKRICRKYNKIYKDELPNITPHTCRHTFCSNMAKAGMNPKTLQILMGHADIGVTLNTYTHVDFTDIQREMSEVSKKEL